MKIKALCRIVTATGTHAAGSVFEINEEDGKQLIRRAFAVETKEAASDAPKKPEAPKTEVIEAKPKAEKQPKADA